MILISAGQSTNAGGIEIGMGTLESRQGVGWLMDDRINCDHGACLDTHRGDIDEYSEGGTGNGQVGAWLVFDIVT